MEGTYSELDPYHTQYSQYNWQDNSLQVYDCFTELVTI